jgi:rSAM/selenodomain-associated transferase 1
MTDPARVRPSAASTGAAAQLVVMAKHPTVGTVKTRLAATLGAELACALHLAFVLDLDARLAGLAMPVTWAFSPPDAAFPSLVAPARCLPQVAGDLGMRMDAAIRACFASRGLPVIVIGVDSPHLDLARLLEAAAALDSGCDVVLGPARDGGYYLIGLREPDPVPFAGIPWGTPMVLRTTLERLREAGRSVSLLAETFDVDDGEGLAALREVIEGGTVPLPFTGLVLSAVAGAAPRDTPPSR